MMLAMTTLGLHQGGSAAQDSEPRPDDYRGSLPARLAPDLIRECSRIDAVRGVLHTAGEWLAIVLAAALCERFWQNPWCYVLTVAYIGGRQHALFHLAHEGTHYHLFKNRRVNDWFADLFLAWPCLHSVPLYRQRHFGHHRNIGTLDDPHIKETYARNPNGWRFPKSPLRLAGWLLYRLSGLSFPRYLRAFASGFFKASSRRLVLVKVFYYAVLCLGISLLRGWGYVLFYWVIPLATWTPMVRDLRLAAEHFAIGGEADTMGRRSRTVLPGVLGRVFICSKNTFMHSEHHDYPSVPFYHLPRIHREMRGDARLSERLHLTIGYWRVLGELAGRLGRAPRASSIADA